MEITEAVSCIIQLYIGSYALISKSSTNSIKMKATMTGFPPFESPETYLVFIY